MPVYKTQQISLENACHIKLPLVFANACTRCMCSMGAKHVLYALQSPRADTVPQTYVVLRRTEEGKKAGSMHL